MIKIHILRKKIKNNKKKTGVCFGGKMTKSINKIIKYTVLRTTLRSFFLKNKSNTTTKKISGQSLDLTRVYRH